MEISPLKQICKYYRPYLLSSKAYGALFMNYVRFISTIGRENSR